MTAFLGPGLEWALRPFAERERILQRAIAARPLPDEDAVAHIRWGGKSTFGFKTGMFVSQPPPIVHYPEPEPEEPEDAPAEITVDFAEVARSETEVRVENPDDSEIYVMVKNTDVILFSGPDLRPDSMIGREGRQSKIYYRFTLTTPEE